MASSRSHSLDFCVDKSKWEDESDIGPILDSSCWPAGSHSLPSDSHLDFASIGQSTSRTAFRDWSRDFEVKVTHALAQTQLEQTEAFVEGYQQAPKHSRQGEVEQVCSFFESCQRQLVQTAEAPSVLSACSDVS